MPKTNLTKIFRTHTDMLIYSFLEHWNNLKKYLINLSSTLTICTTSFSFFISIKTHIHTQQNKTKEHALCLSTQNINKSPHKYII